MIEFPTDFPTTFVKFSQYFINATPKELKSEVYFNIKLITDDNPTKLFTKMRQ